MTEVIDVVAAVFVLAGTFFCLSGAVGIVRFPDVITRLHAATKPQVFGLILILTGVALRMWSWQVTLLGTLIVAFQIMTAPVSAHMVSRTAYRLGLWDSDHALADELAEDLEEAGFTHPQDEDEGVPARFGYRWKPAATWLPPTKFRQAPPPGAAPEPGPSAQPEPASPVSPSPGAPQHDTVVAEEQQVAAQEAGTTSAEVDASWDEGDDED
ncbi:monovalent cation/H(+) antiporter subunit G [Aestuariimicrobium sp. Y1814]|uniref:monovalent cation/H(+) antiporter subunit G n=1 Tax=Aestuariimicrobium sp. Y1814 TaxID=3418742 RepID=UPI003DA77403